MLLAAQNQLAHFLGLPRAPRPSTPPSSSSVLVSSACPPHRQPTGQRQPSSPTCTKLRARGRMLFAPSRLPLPRLPPRRLRLAPGSPMASTLAILRPSAPAPLAGRRARAASPATARVALSSRSRYSSARVSLGSEVAVGAADALFADYKPTTAFLFPGQGAQTVGMGAEAQSVPAASKLFSQANEILGYDLLDLCTNGPKEKLDSTVISQPAIYVTSLAAVEVLRARDGGQDVINSVDVTCGLSLGEYTALAFAGAFSFEDGLKLVKLRGEAMQDASDAANSAMVSVIGLDSEKVQELCDAANEEVDESEKVQIANFLCPGNYAVSGGVKGIEVVEAKAKSFKARMTVRLAVAGAFHTSFMQPAVSSLESALAATEIRTPRIPVISNVDAQPHSDPDTIKQILARQVTSPVQWETTVKTLMGKGLEKSYELGPGKVIAGILKRINKGASIENIGA